ncbi:hypothetical protein V2J09_017342 [Rumex salicifolius]
MERSRLANEDDDWMTGTGFAVSKEQRENLVKFTCHGKPAQLKHGSVVIAAITSCTNTSNPSVMVAAGLVAKRACELGLEVVQSSILPDMFKNTYESITKGNPMWNSLEAPTSRLYEWDPNSTYIRKPPFFKNMSLDAHGPRAIKEAYCLIHFGDGITTDHISPPGNIHKDSPAAEYLLERGVERKDFNSYGSRRGNHQVMARGTFANIRIVNKLLNGEVGPNTIHFPTGEKLHRYKEARHDTIILAGAEYGIGSRDWAAKGPIFLLHLQGVKAVIAKSFEMTHRNNLVAMGIIPLTFKLGEDADTLGLTGQERYTVDLPTKVNDIRPGQQVDVVATNSRIAFTCTIGLETEKFSKI